MTWTYSGDPSLSSLDAVRFMLGDIDSTVQLLSNEEINYLLVGRTPRGAAAEAASSLAARFAREVSFSADGVSVSVEQLQDKYAKLALELRAGDRRDRQRGYPYGGGYSRADVAREQADSDRIPLHFASHIHDNPSAGQIHHSDGGTGSDLGEYEPGH